MTVRALFTSAAICRTALPTVLALYTSTATVRADEPLLKFAGQEWSVQEGPQVGPGPNAWDRRNAWVDDQGQLHLAIRQRDGVWTCASVMSTKTFHHGLYQFQITGRPDEFDPNIVLGLFLYPSPDVGPDTTHEIDIEFARWGYPDAPVGNYAVWPVKDELMHSGHQFPVVLKGSATTHRFDWRPNQIVFASVHGHTDGSEHPIGSWTFARKPARSYISTSPMPVMMNLWLHGGRPPTDGKDIEIVIKDFQYRPMAVRSGAPNPQK